MKVSVFVEFAGRKEITVVVPERAIVDDVIRMALSMMEDLTGSVPSRNPKHYRLHIAEDDGEPDEDMPPLEPQRIVKKLGLCAFSLCTSIPASGEGGLEKEVRLCM
jgi:hypothetical protein